MHSGRHHRTIPVLLMMLFVGGCETPQKKEPTGPAAPPRLAPRPAARRVEARRPPMPPQPAPLRGQTLVIDAGHGGKDQGARGVGPRVEKEVNLQISRRLVQMLRERGANVITTRDDDRFLELEERAGIAERSRADLFVSIHADSAQRDGARGATVYIARNASVSSMLAGETINAALVQAGIESRGVRRAGFKVLVGHSRPAVLIECGFLTNHYEAHNLARAEYQQRLAAAVAEGITRHLRGM